MRFFRNLSVLLFSPLGILVFLLASCEHKELCYDHSHTVDVRVVLDWKNAAEASPSSMRLYLFPQDGGDVLSYGLADCRGGNITVPTGCYKILCLNSDTRSILYRNIGRFTDFEAYTVNDVWYVVPLLRRAPTGHRRNVSPDPPTGSGAPVRTGSVSENPTGFLRFTRKKPYAGTGWKSDMWKT